MKNAFDSLIFDLDGTLWYACGAIAKGWNEAFIHFDLNYSVTAADIEKVAGHPFDKCVNALFPDIDIRSYPKFIDVFSSFEKKHMLLEGGELYPLVETGLRQLQKHYKLFIVSNCSDWYLEEFLKKISAPPLFQAVDCFGKSGIKKVEMIKQMMKRNHLKKSLYIGDTVHDQNAAVDAGIAFAHAAYGYGKNLKAQFQFENFEQLVSYFMHEASNLEKNE